MEDAVLPLLPLLSPGKPLQLRQLQMPIQGFDALMTPTVEDDNASEGSQPGPILWLVKHHSSITGTSVQAVAPQWTQSRRAALKDSHNQTSTPSSPQHSSTHAFLLHTHTFTLHVRCTPGFGQTSPLLLRSSLSTRSPVQWTQGS